ncbi:HNH endonuclease [Gordonia phage JuJu]|uniref:HNH endonuclease n=1 Tax=Gordonia phage JuJu TaxID=2590929 RepID=A0A516KR86_9CAUD|nr:HNH endonuclease [Gordonia phage JuJu]QDP44204.1 HNH endonuclease [Gordonia phage JuJu]
MAPRKTTTQKHLGWSHQQNARHLKAQHVDGTPCWWCGRPMWRDRTRNYDYNPHSTDPASGSLAADHSHPRAHGGRKADRLLHGQCNKERGAGNHDHQRPALTGTQPNPAPNNLGPLAMTCWP